MYFSPSGLIDSSVLFSLILFASQALAWQLVRTSQQVMQPALPP